MIRLSARLAVSGGRESVVRLALTAVGVALGVVLLLLSAAADPAIQAHRQRSAWQDSGQRTAAEQEGGDRLLWHLREDAVAGQEIVLLRVAPTGPDAPVPVGLDRVPAPDELYVSPALARLLDELPADRLADRFPRAVGTIDDAHLNGPDELVAVLGMARRTLEGQPGVVPVNRIRTTPEAFGFTDAFRMLLAIGAVGVLLPVVVFVSTSTRLGAARREQRFAALRLAGATPRQTNLVAAFEAGVAAVAGTILGLLGYQALRAPVAGIQIDGNRSFLSDVQAPAGWMAVILVGVPLLAVVAAMVSLRRLQISPLGVARRAVRARPTARRLLPLAVGSAGFVVSLSLGSDDAGPAILVGLVASFAAMIYGIVLAGPWLTVLTARAIGRLSGRPDALLAGRRLEDDPASGFRAVSGLVLAVFVVSVFSGVSPAVRADNERSGGLIDGTTMGAFLPVGSTSAQAAAALDASRGAGGGRGIVVHAEPSPRSGPDAPPGALVAACADLAVVLPNEPCPPGGTARIELTDTIRLEPSPYSVEEVADLPADLLVVETDGDVATTDRVRTAIQRTVPGSITWLGAESEARANRRITEVERLANLGLAMTLLVAGCSLAVAVAGGIIERKRPFALLRLSGVHLGELQRVAMLEAAAPLLLIAAASALVGLATSAVIVGLLIEAPWEVPTLGYWGSLTGGLALAIGVAAATLPLLGRTTAPSAVRFE